jgi:hypothetical protein
MQPIGSIFGGRKTMKEHPILFSGEMVKAILDGRKTQTRRVIKLPDDDMVYTPWVHPTLGLHHAFSTGRQTGLNVSCPYGYPDDRLWVRETWRAEELESGLDGVRYASDNHFRPIENTREAADAWGEAAFDKKGNHRNPMAWRPSIFMPRWASRITLEIVNVRVQQLQDIGAADAISEGCPAGNDQAVDWYRILWDTINHDRGYGWDTNPFVWVVEFKLFVP